MTSLQFQLLLLLSGGQQVSEQLYVLESSEAHIRRVLAEMVVEQWIDYGTPVKRDTGQGRPMNTFLITDTGTQVLDDYEKHLEKLR